MRIVPLAAVPNQSFTVTLDNIRWVLRLITTQGVLACDVERQGVILLRGCRVVSGEPLIPYKYLQTGNFIFIMSGDDLPAYSLFGVSQTLVYLTAAEIAALPTITAGDIAALRSPSFLTSDEGFYLTTDTGELLTDD